ncbi:non-ribosomal peptide synthetase [Streptomyces reniochalinae]|uniref:Amino acid adenylation domain-containing protein n=1 Tax=Streptomyces reniochalinae TaxID=2250578 RepID=A0A367E8P8_9ACTN|nr:non-ribosomal peptide synthetase [Streptomyces reniochalinae]RCG13620.1 amino acid adenylation domain-containing protein [Streptomyces reniochalinae]
MNGRRSAPHPREELPAQLASWNDTARPFPDDKCLHHLFDEQAERTPDATALLSDTETMTYRQLGEAANRVAHKLRQLGAGPDVPVGICAERGVELVIGLLGILEAGAAYVPLDPDYPTERLRYVLQDTACPVVVAQERTRELVSACSGGVPIVLPREDLVPAGEDITPPGADEVLRQPAQYGEAGAGPRDLAYIIYTSGSTGAPKGVCVEHTGVVNRLHWMQRTFQLGPDDVVLQKTPCSFDVSVWEFFWPLITGARLALARPDGHRDPAYLADFIARHHVTAVHFVPSMLSEFLDTPGLERTRSLRRVICSGEALPAAVMNRACEQLTGTLHNLYGPTEASIDVSSYACEAEPSVREVPIGSPIDNTRLYVLDEDMAPVPCGETGQLYIGGVQLARGYHNRPALTAEKFVPDPYGEGRLYQTGDLARRRHDGVLLFAGRADHQVKIRGHRVELGEIEAALLSVHGVREAAVLVHETTSGHRQLVAHLVPFAGEELDPQHIKELLGRHLPAHMIPVRFSVWERLPLTGSGKTDRRALEAAPAPGARSRKATPAATPREETLVRIWREVLDLPDVGTDEDFFELGGDSIQAMRIVARARDTGLVFSVTEVLRQRTVRELASAARNLEPREDGRAAPAGGGTVDTRTVEQLQDRYPDYEDAYALSPLQAGMLFHTLYTPESTDYFEQALLSLDGTLDQVALEQAWRQVVERHPALRTTVHWRGVPHPLQVVHRETDVDVRRVDWRHLGAEGRRAALDDLMAQDRAEGFALDIRPPHRLTVVDRGAGEAELLLSFHHVILDGWSLSLLVEDVAECYAARMADRSVRLSAPGSFRDFIDWRAGSDQEEEGAHWHRVLSGFTEATPLPGDDPNAEPGENQELTVAVSGPRAAALRVFCRSEGLTVSTLTHAAWGLVLARSNRSRDVVVGSTLSGRPTELPGVEAIVGMFINTLPVRVRIPATASVSDWLQGFQQELVSYLDHMTSALADIHEWSDVPAGQPMFSSIVVAQNHPPIAAGSPREGARFALRSMIETTGYPLVVVVDEEQDAIRFTLRHQSGRIGASEAHRLGQRLLHVLTSLTRDPASPVSTIGLLAPGEWDEIVCSWNDTGNDWDNNRTIIDLIEEQADRTPHDTALTFGEESMSYRELDERAGRLACHLRSLGAGKDKLVGVLHERCPDMVIALLAVMKTGAGYVPLAPDNPAERLRYVVQDAQLELLVAQQHLLDRLGQGWGGTCVTEADAAHIAGLPATRPANTPGPDDLAYVIYTSGSTGKPKGVACHHRGLVNYLRSCVEHYAYRGTNGAPLFSSFGFDMIVPNLYTPLIMGQPVHLLPEGLNPGELAEHLVEKSPYAFIKMTPGHLDLLAKQLTEAEARDLAGVLAVGADAFSPRTLAAWRELDPETPVLNEYGPTEASVANSFWVTGKGVGENQGELLPIGYPIANTTLYVLDDDFLPLPEGVPGEVYIGGVCCARGYLNKPGLTADRFVPDPFSSLPGSRMYRTGDLGYWLPGGNLQFIGRNDHQVKIRGYRIELGEIEQCLGRHPGIRHVIVLGLPDPSGVPRLACYYVPREAGRDVPADELHRWAGETLPAYMIPTTYTAIEAIPLDANGKVDRKALPAPSAHRADADAPSSTPRNAAEKDLCAILEEVLHLERVGIHENFFQLGGDSILTIHVCARAQREGFRLSPKDIFDHPTVAELAAHAGWERTHAVPGPRNAAARAGQYIPLLPLQAWFSDQRMEHSHHYNQSVQIEAYEVDVDAFRGALHDLVARHDALRLTFTGAAGSLRQNISASAPEPALTVVDPEEGEGPGDEFESRVREAATRVQASLDPSSGRLVAAGLFRRGPRKPDRILLAVHHLAVDTLSWEPLLADLSAAYRRRTGATDAPAEPVGASFADWAQWVHQYARSQDVDVQEKHWQAVTSGATRIPLDLGGGPVSTVAEQAHVSLRLPAEATSRLLRDVPSTYRVRVKELLAAALCLTLNEWADGSVRVDLENHGRDPLSSGLDLSRCVGWFTTVQPVRVETSEGDDTALRRVKETLRTFPDEGLGFSTRWLTAAESSTPPADVVLNYHGIRDRQARGSTAFKTVTSLLGEEKAPQQQRPYALEVEAEVRDGHLTVEWGYARTRHREETVRQLAETFLDRVEELTAYCLAHPGGHTPSDFPLAGLTQRELDTLGDALEDAQDIYPLVPLQQGMLFHARLAPGEHTYTEQQVYRAPAGDTRHLEEAFSQVAERHAALRTTFAWRKLSEPVQIVHRHAPLDVRHRDLSTLEGEERDAAWEALLREDLEEGFSLSRTPPVRVTLVRTEEPRPRVVLSFHHLLMDGWSVAVLLDEVRTAYSARLRGQPCALPPAVPYRRFVEWTRGQDPGAAEDFWRKELAGLRRPGRLPGQWETGTREGVGNLEAELGSDVGAALAAYCSDAGVTAAAVVQGAWALVLAGAEAYDDCGDVVFGSTVAGRPADLPGAESMVGLLINTLPSRVGVDRDSTVRTWLRTLQARHAAAREHASHSLTDLHGWSDVPRGEPLFESLVLVEGGTHVSTAEGDEHFVESEAYENVGYPVTICFKEAASPKLQVLYDLGRCGEETAREIRAEFDRTLRRLLRCPGEASVGSLLSELSAHSRA